jgi:hypothetical protein
MDSVDEHWRSSALYRSLLDIAVGNHAVANDRPLQGLQRLRKAMPAFKAAADESDSYADLASLNTTIIDVLQRLLNNGAIATGVVDLKSDLAAAIELQQQITSWLASECSTRRRLGSDVLLQSETDYATKTVAGASGHAGARSRRSPCPAQGSPQRPAP